MLDAKIYQANIYHSIVRKEYHMWLSRNLREKFLDGINTCAGKELGIHINLGMCAKSDMYSISEILHIII